MISLIPNKKKKDEGILYVVGNGFDIAHHLPTRYECFHQWLLKSGPKYFVRDFERLYPDVNDAVGRWCDVESALGNVTLEQAVDFDLNYLECPDEVRKEKSSHDAYRCGENLRNIIVNLPPLLNDWATTISTKGVPPLYELSKDAYFLSFNYTMTLEDVYNIEESNVLHIHEAIGNSKLLVVGCGDAIFEEDDYDPEREEVDINLIRNLLSHNKKPVKAILEEQEPKKWFGSLSEVTSVVVFGHSCSKVDKPYFEEISKNITPNASWYFYVHESEENERYKRFAKSIKRDGQIIEIINS